MGIEQQISFRSGGFTIRGVLHLPDREKPPVAIGSHGLFSDGNSPKQIALAEGLNRMGIGFLRFHHRGCGDSEGVFREVTSLPGRAEDVEKAIHFVSKHPLIGSRWGLFGSSMGGATALHVASRMQPSCIVTLAASLRSKPILEAAKATGDLRDLPLSFYQTNLSFDIADQTVGLSPILIFHGDADQVVPIDNAHELFDNAGEPKRLIVQKKGDHPVSDPHHQEEFIRETCAWFGRFLLVKQDEAL